MTIWKKIFSHWDLILLTLLILLYIFVLGTLSVLRHDAFASRFDLSNMDQTLWYTLHGHFFSLRYPDEFVSRFAVHADLILILLAPLYLIKDDVRMLLIAQTIFLALGALPVYLLSLKILKNKIIGLSLVLVYLLNPGLEWTNIYEFHGVSLSIFFFLAAFYFAYVKKWLWYWIFVFLALLTKEEISLNLAMLGAAVLFVFKNKKVGLATMIIGILWFITMVYFVIPYFSPQGIHWALEEQIALDPKLFYVKSSLDYYLLLLKPFTFLPLLGFPWLLLSAPALIINIFRDTKSIVFHYDSGLVPALTISSIFALSYLARLKKPFAKPVLYLVTVAMLSIAFRFNYHYSPLPTTPSCWCLIYDVKQEDRDFEKALQNLPDDAFITSSLEIRPHVSHRELSFALPSATESARYIAMITQNRIVGNYEPKEFENKLIPVLLSDEKFKVLFKSEHFYLFERAK